MFRLSRACATFFSVRFRRAAPAASCCARPGARRPIDRSEDRGRKLRARPRPVPEETNQPRHPWQKGQIRSFGRLRNGGARNFFAFHSARRTCRFQPPTTLTFLLFYNARRPEAPEQCAPPRGSRDRKSVSFFSAARRNSPSPAISPRARSTEATALFLLQAAGRRFRTWGSRPPTRRPPRRPRSSGSFQTPHLFEIHSDQMMQGLRFPRPTDWTSWFSDASFCWRDDWGMAFASCESTAPEYMWASQSSDWLVPGVSFGSPDIRWVCD